MTSQSRKRSSSSSAVSACSAGEGLPEKVKALQVQAYKKVDAFTSQYPKLEGLLKEGQTKTSVPAPALFLAGSGLIALLLVLLLSFNGLAVLAGFSYPAVKTFDALQAGDRTAQKHLMSYWVLYNLINISESFLPLFWIPFYPLIKLFFFLWAFNPKTKGAAWVYKVLIRAFLLPHLGIDTSSETDALLTGNSNSKDAPKDAGKGVKPCYSLKVDIAALDLPMLDEDYLMPQCFVRVIPPASRPKSEGEETRWKTQAGKANETKQEWRDHITAINLSTLDDNSLEIEVRNNGTYTDRFLGVVRFPLKQVKAAGSEYKATYPLLDPEGSIKGGPSGELEVTVTVTRT